VLYAVGHGTLKGSERTQPRALRSKGFTDVEIDNVERALAQAFDIRFVFTSGTLGEQFCAKVLGASDAATMMAPNSICCGARLRKAEIEAPISSSAGP